MQSASGNQPEGFWRWQWLVGLEHIRKPVSDPFMFGAMSRLQKKFLKKCLQEYSASEAAQVYGAFKRVTDVVAGLIAEACLLNYVEALEDVAGLRRNLVEQMMGLEINNVWHKPEQTSRKA